jgi:valyl-tRNA synthetase
MEPKIKDKSWNPAVEQTIRKKWEETDIYKFSIKKEKEAFVIDTPPPYRHDC